MTLQNALGPTLAWAILLAAVAGAVAATAAAFILWLGVVRPGHIDGPWRAAWVALLLLVTWCDAVTVAYFILASDAAAVMISALWAIVAIAWGTIALGNWRDANARHTVAVSQPAAQPPDAFARAMACKRHARTVYASTYRSIQP